MLDHDRCAVQSGPTAQHSCGTDRLFQVPGAPLVVVGRMVELATCAARHDPDLMHEPVTRIARRPRSQPPPALVLAALVLAAAWYPRGRRTLGLATTARPNPDLVTAQVAAATRSRCACI
jgi:hypothetical protein